MSISVSEPQGARAVKVKVTHAVLQVELADGRVLTVPTVWYPRLAHGSHRERNRWQLIGGGVGIHWPELDEDISVEGLLAGRRSGETPQSLKRWLNLRVSARAGRPTKAMARRSRR
jgi:hypothetical protein